MRDLLITIAPYLVWFLAITELLLAVKSVKSASGMLSTLSALVCCGLAIDAAIQAAGVLIGEGTFLKGISQIRYILHGILVPLLIPIAFYVFGMKKKGTKIVVWAITGTVIAAGIVMGFMTKTEPVLFAGVLRYAQDKVLTPSFARTINTILSFGGVIPLIIVGIVHLFAHKSPFLFLSGLVMFAFSAVAPATGNMDLNFLTTMIGEDLMVFFFSFELVRAAKLAAKAKTDTE